jgi:hypothetical protein
MTKMRNFDFENGSTDFQWFQPFNVGLFVLMVLAVLFRRFRLLVHALPTNPTNQNLHQLAVGCKETQFYILPYCSS